MIGFILRASPGSWVTTLSLHVALPIFPLPSALLAVLVALGTRIAAQDLSVDLVSYWPMETVQGTKTPDLVSGYDLTLNNLTTNDLVPGIRGTCFSFVNARQTLLSRVHG